MVEKAAVKRHFQVVLKEVVTELKNILSSCRVLDSSRAKKHRHGAPCCLLYADQVMPNTYCWLRTKTFSVEFFHLLALTLIKKITITTCNIL